MYYEANSELPIPRTDGTFPIHYINRKLTQSQWPEPEQRFTAKGKSVLERTDEGLEAVPGYIQYRTMGPKNHKYKAPVYVDEFQRRRGVGPLKPAHNQIPISRNFLSNYTNNQLYSMRQAHGMYKLLFWNPSKYTPLQAHQWNQYLDEHPNRQHELPVPTTPESKVPEPPYPYNKAPFYPKPPFHRKVHKYLFNQAGNAVGMRTRNPSADLRYLEHMSALDAERGERLNPRMEELAKHNVFVVPSTGDGSQQLIDKYLVRSSRRTKNMRERSSRSSNGSIQSFTGSNRSSTGSSFGGSQFSALVDELFPNGL